MPKTSASDRRAVSAIRTEARLEDARRAAQSPEDLPPAEVMDQLAGVEVQELDGSWGRLGNLWQDQPVALIFLRHYG